MSADKSTKIFVEKVVFKKAVDIHGELTCYGNTIFVNTLHVPFKISENIEEVDKEGLENIIVNLLENSKKQNKTILKYTNLIEKIANTNELHQENNRLKNEVSSLQSKLDKICNIYEER